jgi:DNA-binding transcriptional MerR regulator
MPRVIEGITYYGTSEVCSIAGISRPTLFRWLKRGILDKMYRDRRGWRLFSEENLSKIRATVETVDVEYP